MDFARQQRDPTRHMIGIGFVILVHILVIWALFAPAWMPRLFSAATKSVVKAITIFLLLVI